MGKASIGRGIRLAAMKAERDTARKQVDVLMTHNIAQSERISQMAEQVEFFFQKLSESDLTAHAVPGLEFCKWWRDRIIHGRVSGTHATVIPGDFTVFTQQHYTPLAKLIADEKRCIHEDETSPQVIADKMAAIAELQYKLQQMLVKDNPKFKELIFVGAAGYVPPDKAE